MIKLSLEIFSLTRFKAKNIDISKECPLIINKIKNWLGIYNNNKTYKLKIISWLRDISKV